MIPNPHNARSTELTRISWRIDDIVAVAMHAYATRPTLSSINTCVQMEHGPILTAILSFTVSQILYLFTVSRTAATTHASVKRKLAKVQLTDRLIAHAKCG